MTVKKPTVAEYAIDRLADLGIDAAFGVPGDFAFAINDAIEDNPRVRFILTSNELNAAYAADGYARVAGAGMLTTTYAVGELSAINGVFGSKAENAVVFHLAGAPSTRLTRSGRHLHHSLGDGETGQFYPISAASACVHTILTPTNAVAEMERVIATAFANRQPAFIQIAQDQGYMEIVDEPIKGVPIAQLPAPRSEKTELADAVAAIMDRLKEAKKPVVLASYKLARFCVADLAEKIISTLQIPFATNPMDKATISEAHPLFIGHYKGHNKTASAEVRDIIEGSDCVLDLGQCIFDDLSVFGAADIQKDNHIVIAPHHVDLMKHGGMVDVAMTSFSPVWMGDVMTALLEQASSLPKYEPRAIPAAPLPDPIDLAGIITYQSIHAAVSDFFQPKDIVIAETGTASLSLGTVRLPADAVYHNQTLWGSIGWATPASLGTSLAAPDRRTILITGDGSHQMTATEIGTMGRYGANPIIVCINNAVYGVEEFLEHNIPRSYNDLVNWDYAALPTVFGCKGWKSVKVATNEEFVAALKDARAHTTGGTYIEIILGVALLPAMNESEIKQLDMVKNPSYRY
jgi:indolepyruvate decarboxylase